MKKQPAEAGLTYSEKFSRFTVECRYEQLSASELTKIKQCILDQIGVQLVSSTLPWNRIVYDYARETGAPGPCTVVGTDARLSVLDAAFVNATFAQGCELDDFGHAGAASVPTAMALAEYKGQGGKAVITSVAIGYEIVFRLFDALVAQLLKRGFHQQCVIGTFAAAAIAGKFLGLTEEQLVQALGIAGSHASGTAEYDQSGGDVKRIHNGLGVRGGIQSAMLAQRGFTGPRSIFEGKRGIFHTFVDSAREENIDRNLGSQFVFPEKIVTKFCPSAGSTHTSIDAFGQLVDRFHFDACDIKSIRVGLQPYGIAHGATIVIPKDVVGAQFSTAFSLALRLVHGRNDLDLYMDPKNWSDPRIAEIARRVEPYVDPAAIGERAYGSRVTVELKAGKALEAYKPFCKGSAANPASADEMRKKFQSLAGYVLAPARADRVCDMVDRLETMESIAPLMELLKPPSMGE